MFTAGSSLDNVDVAGVLGLGAIGISVSHIS